MNETQFESWKKGQTAFYCFVQSAWGIDGLGFADSVEDIVVTMLELHDGTEVNCLRVDTEHFEILKHWGEGGYLYCDLAYEKCDESTVKEKTIYS